MLIDTRDGKAFDIVTLPVKQMGMTLARSIMHYRYCISSQRSNKAKQNCLIH